MTIEEIKSQITTQVNQQSVNFLFNNLAATLKENEDLKAKISELQKALDDPPVVPTNP